MLDVRPSDIRQQIRAQDARLPAGAWVSALLTRPAYVVGHGGPLEPNQFVIRWHGVLVRGDKVRPLLYATRDAAQTEADKLNEEVANGGT